MVGCIGLISSCENGKQWACHADVISFSAVISACEKGTQWQSALELLREMPCRVLLPDMSSYGAAAIAIIRMCEDLAFPKCLACPPKALCSEYDQGMPAS